MSAQSGGANSHVVKILPLSDCAPRIIFENPSKLIIPVDQGGGGYPPQTQEIPLSKLRQRNHEAAIA